MALSRPQKSMTTLKVKLIESINEIILNSTTFVRNILLKNLFSKYFTGPRLFPHSVYFRVDNYKPMWTFALREKYLHRYRKDEYSQKLRIYLLLKSDNATCPTCYVHVGVIDI